MEAPAKTGLHGDGKGGLGRLVCQLGPLGGHHKALVVGRGADANSLGVDETVVPVNITIAFIPQLTGTKVWIEELPHGISVSQVARLC